MPSVVQTEQTANANMEESFILYESREATGSTSVPRNHETYSDSFAPSIERSQANGSKLSKNYNTMTTNLGLASAATKTSSRMDQMYGTTYLAKKRDRHVAQLHGSSGNNGPVHVHNDLLPQHKLPAIEKAPTAPRK